MTRTAVAPGRGPALLSARQDHGHGLPAHLIDADAIGPADSTATRQRRGDLLAQIRTGVGLHLAQGVHQIRFQTADLALPVQGQPLSMCLRANCLNLKVLGRRGGRGIATSLWEQVGESV